MPDNDYFTYRSENKAWRIIQSDEDKITHREGAGAYDSCIWAKGGYTPEWVGSSLQTIYKHLWVLQLAHGYLSSVLRTPITTKPSKFFPQPGFDPGTFCFTAKPPIYLASTTTGPLFDNAWKAKNTNCLKCTWKKTLSKTKMETWWKNKRPHSSHPGLKWVEN